MATSIFNLSSPTSPAPKVYISHASIPHTYLDPSQPPVKRSPYRQINDAPFLRSVQICMPSSLHAKLFPHQSSSESSPSYHVKYAKVILSLRDILENEALRKGNYILISSPEDSPVRICLHRGTLTLIIPQQIYQRSGLTFPTTKLQSGGRKHEKNSALQKIDIDLRQPGMTKGRKGFDRLMYAAKNVDGLREARLCLCVDLDQQLADFGLTRGKKRKREDVRSTKVADQREGDMSASTATNSNATSGTSIIDIPHNAVLSKHHPTHVADHGTTSLFTDVLVPPIFNTLSTLAHSSSKYHPSKMSPLTSILEDDMHETIEYLSLLFLESPQLTKQQYGKTDPYLSHYRLPDPSFTLPKLNNADPAAIQQEAFQECNGVEIPPRTKTQDLQVVTYEGLIPSDWMVQVVVDLIRQSRAEAQGLVEEVWIVIKAVAHEVEPVGRKDGYLIVLHGAVENDPKGICMLADQEEQSPAVEQMVIDGEDSTAEQEKTETGENEAKISVGGFDSVTCFEFIDSFN